MDKKTCKSCGIPKKYEEFYTSSTCRDGYLGICKGCKKESQKRVRARQNLLPRQPKSREEKDVAARKMRDYRKTEKGKLSCKNSFNKYKASSKKKDEISELELLDTCLNLLDYDMATGKLYWRVDNGPARKGGEAGHFTSDGYMCVSIKANKYLSHRICWLMHYGSSPKLQIDHINGLRSDNRIENLRESDQLQNMENLGIRRNNKSGFIGVSVSKRPGMWTASIQKNGKSKFLGSYDSPQKAFTAYCEAKRLLHIFNPEVRKS